MVRTREDAAKRAEASRTNTPGSCQLWTRTLFDAPSAGDFDHDGDADAVDGWKSEPVAARHNDRNPPRGVPVAYSGGSHGYGHRAISLGGGKIRSTDAGGSGRVATVDLDWPEKHWGLRYLGWSETIDGQAIPKGTPKPSKPGWHPSTGKLPVDLIDLSHWNAISARAIHTAATAGVGGFYHKATEGTSYVDPQYATARGLVYAAKAGFGAYHFARPADSDGTTQAKHFLSVATPKRGTDFRIMLDLEDRGGKTKAALTKWVGEFVAEVVKQTGVKKHLIYTGYDLDDNFGWKLWVARYHDGNALPRIPKPWDRWQVRQFSDGAYGNPKSVPGFTKVDLNNVVGPVSALKMPKLPQPPPPPPPPPATRSLDFRVHLVPGNKVRSAGSIRGDMGIVNQKTHGHSAVVFNTERESSAARQAVSDGLGAGWTRVLANEDTIAYGSRWRAAGDPSALLLAKADPSMFHVSPRRYLDTVPLAHDALDAVTLGMCGTHLVSEANCVHKGVKGRAWREKTWPIQVADVLRAVKALVDSGVPVVLAGDFNTGVFFNGKQLFAELTKRFGDKAVHVHNGSLDHIFLVSTDKVRLSEVGTEVVTDNASDHAMVTALIRAEVIA